MSSRLDVALKRHPEHEAGLCLLASRDPSRKLKYLDWSAKVLASGQALAPEIADVVELFHRFNGQAFGPRRREQRIRSDIYTYRPQDLAHLRDNLLKIKRAQDRKLKKRERLYRIEGAIEADVIYDSDDLIVRHIKNKQASVHYGGSTKWCIAMLREGYFEDYETNNATFFFFEYKQPVGDDFDKVAVMMPRSGESSDMVEAFTALDQRVDMMMLAKKYGTRVFDIFREIYERSASYPGSAMFNVYSGQASQEQLEAAFAGISKLPPYEKHRALTAICCNDAAPQTLLKKALTAARRLRVKKSKRRRHRREWDWTRDAIAAVSIHPNVPVDVREQLTKELVRRHVDVDTIRRREATSGRVELTYEMRNGRTIGSRRRARHRRLPPSAAWLRGCAERLARRVVRLRKQAKTAQRREEKRAAAARAVKKRRTR